MLFDSVDVPGTFSARMREDIVIRRAVGDISDRETVRGLIDRDDISVFHLASVVSGGG